VGRHFPRIKGLKLGAELAISFDRICKHRRASVKYKAAPSREDVNQIVTYAVRYRVTKVLLICVSTNSEGVLERIGTISGIEILCYSFSLPAANLDAEEANLVSAIRDRIAIQ
jgi:hypothetical protein